LENPNFRTREAATKALAELDAQAAAAMRAALAKAPRAESRQRLEKLIAGLVRDPTAEEIRAGRAVKAVELASTADARAMLAAWAGGAPGMRLTEDAKMALARLNKN